MNKVYVEERDGGYWIAGTRVSLDSVVYAFRRGAAPETIRRSFPLLTLEEVYGAITFYLAHEQEIDEHLHQSELKFEAEAQQRREQFRRANPDLYDRLTRARQESEIIARVEPPKQRRRTLDRALGLLATDGPAPTDDEIKQWLDDHRMEKYG
jgi:uncharacterized protein (DUF433 family)